MTTTSTPSAAIEHALSPGGSVTIETVETEVRLRAVDGRVARVRLPNADLSADFRIEAGPDRLEVRPVRRSIFGWHRVRGPLEVEVPRDARVDVQTASGSVLALDLGAGAQVRTASGDVELVGVAGDVTVTAVSGAIRVQSPSSVTLALSSVSGRIEAAVASASSVTSRSMSGAIRLMAGLRGVGPFSLETVSGRITLGTDGPVRLMASTISGEVRSEIGGADTLRGTGPRSMTVGAAGPEVSVRTVSGGVRLVAWAPERGDAPADSATHPSATATAAPTDPLPATDGIARDPEPARDLTGAGDPEEAHDPEESRDSEEARLEILHALASGEITVAEAGSRIDALEARSGE